MSFPKSKRKTDKKFLATFKHMACLVCGGRPAEPDHIITRGAGGGDTPDNVWPLDRRCHMERHRIGIKSFLDKYTQAVEWMTANAKGME